MRIHYLEIVTDDVDGVCYSLAASRGADFGEPDARLGGARIAHLSDGGMVGVRAPMSASEQPVVRPYWLVDDIEAAVAAAADAGAEVAHPPLELSGLGTFAITLEGGTQQGFWQT